MFTVQLSFKGYAYLMLRQKWGSVVCPSCGNLVGVNDERCFTCGRWNPGLWGFAPLLSRLGRDLGFTQFVMWSCIILYLLTLAFDVQGVSTGGLTSSLPAAGASSFSVRAVWFRSFRPDDGGRF